VTRSDLCWLLWFAAWLAFDVALDRLLGLHRCTVTAGLRRLAEGRPLAPALVLAALLAAAWGLWLHLYGPKGWWR
jgi:hypothetical protein